MVGCGDLGIRLGKQLAAEGWRVSAVRRRVDPLPDNFNAITGDYTQLADLTGLQHVLFLANQTSLPSVVSHA